MRSDILMNQMKKRLKQCKIAGFKQDLQDGEKLNSIYHTEFILASSKNIKDPETILKQV